MIHEIIDEYKPTLEVIKDAQAELEKESGDTSTTRLLGLLVEYVESAIKNEVQEKVQFEVDTELLRRFYIKTESRINKLENKSK
jgi:hypothetical protein